ncbi:N-acetylmuramoyl-L-alanine amidase [Paenisporosarcina cavernae]|uniref:N-acetylmuramoyl-L-alanine amidase n=1 Tax=Paenisporosarcina cavernae TaxID=2320858 RepID=A0A385YTC7_9BACL|nr:N-acetylmuramoyl-L-alanine amidase [Paenisporosarcina cavernae]AYC28733.1 N-acetylmuramoyl-L-alanine amidase [Paenisporosarcina cavernae]
MAYEIERRIVKAIPKNRVKSYSYILAHESGNAKNTGEGSLESEVKFMANNWRNAFTHFWVGNKAIIQLAEDGYVAYGAGGYLNPHSPAQVELARVDTQEEFDESYKRYIWLLRHQADKYGIPKTLDSDDRRGVKTHLWISKNLGGTNHTDPYDYLAKWGISKEQFKNDVENGIDLNSKGAESRVNYLQCGDSGGEVKVMQELLVEAGLKISIDGSYGPATEKAVRAFQTTNNLSVDGYYGPVTKAKLLEVPKSKPSKKELYRLVTGTFGSKEAAEKSANILKRQFGWTVYVKEK